MDILPMTQIVTSLDVLEEPFRSKVRGILSDAVERRVFFVVLETRRSYERQQELVADGKSRTLRSLHLVGKACDVVPVLFYGGDDPEVDGVEPRPTMPKVRAVTWDKDHPAWTLLGELADRWGVNWGGRWESFPDFPHLEARAT